MDPKNGYCSDTKTFKSLRPSVPLPPLNEPLSIIEYTVSLLNSPTTGIDVSSTTFLIDSTTGHRLSYADFLNQTRNLASSLQARYPSLSKNNVAFVLSPTSVHVPVVYFALLSLGIIVSPANLLSSSSELTHMVQLCKPLIAFATKSNIGKIHSSFPLGTIILDSPEFLSMIETPVSSPISYPVIHQSDSAAILYSSGTTGRVKGVELTHRNLIALMSGLYHNKYNNSAADEGENTEVEQHVSFMTLPLFHVFGFFMVIRAASMGETMVMTARFDFEKMLAAVEKYRVTYIPVSPPLVVAMAKSDLVLKYDLSSLKLLACGGAPLGKEVAERFKSRFPNVEILQGYGLTETTGGSTGMNGIEETDRYGSAGRLSVNLEAKIVDPDSGETLPPGQRGELWLRGPTIMKGYVGDKQATSATLNPEGWLKTGDLCYFDADGFLYVVDRLKELIKYKAYQVPPAELEHLLQSIPDVADAAVIPYPDEEAGQIPMAYIVRRPGSTISESQIIDVIAKQVAPYKKIRRVAFINAIPKSPAGKILRRELVNHATNGTSARL